MKALLLGPNGQLGHDIGRSAERGAWSIDLEGAGRQTVDVEDRAALGRFLDGASFDVLINCTSYHKTDEVESNASRAFAVNAHAVKTMSECCARKTARFFHVSTDYVFGRQARSRPYGEDDCLGPVNIYGASKALGETFAQLACPDTTILRVASLFGVAGASGKGGNFVETMLRVARETGELRVVNDQTMSPTATMDVAETVLKLIADAAPPGIYHVVNSRPATWFEFARGIIQQAGVPANVQPITSADFPTAALRPGYSVLDNSKVAQAVGPIRPWPEALAAYLRDKGHCS